MERARAAALPGRRDARRRRRHASSRRVVRSGAPARVERYDAATGTLAATVHSAGYRAAVAAPVNVGGRLWGVLVAASTSDEPLPEGLEQRLCDFADLVAQALANADAYEKLAASRARLVEVGDAERQRLERNLHDGAQQRLVSVALELSMVAARLESDPRGRPRDAGDRPGRPRPRARRAARAGARHPPGRARPSAGSARRSTPSRRAPRSPSRSPTLPDERLAAPIEAAAYYVVAESVTNVAKYAHASSATVSVARSNGAATVTVVRRRRRRRRSGRRLGAARARGPRRGPQRPARGRQPARRRHAHQGGDPARLTQV